MKKSPPDIIILTGVPKGQGLHGLTPAPLPIAQLAPKDKIQINEPVHRLIKVGVGAAIGLAAINIIAKIFNVR